MLPPAASAAVALVAGLALTPVVRTLAQRSGLVARPRDDRWHRTPTALLGGVAIYVAFMLAYLLVGRRSPVADRILFVATLMFAVGLVDDLFRIKPYAKLVMQLAAAGLTVTLGYRLPWTSSIALDNLITIFWLVGITNAINLLDNMDGLAAGIAGIAACFLAVNFLMSDQVAAAVVPVTLVGAVLAFLVFNFQPASIFMGDCGSMFLGFLLAGTALLSEYGRSRSVTAVLFTPVLILLIPIFDTTLVTISRRLTGRAISTGGRDHASHRLVALGMSERRAVLTLYAFAVVCGTLALSVRVLGTEAGLVLVPAAGLTILFVGLHLGTVSVYDRASAIPRESTVITALVEFQYKRRVLEVLLDVILVALAYYGAYVLRFEGSLPPEQLVILVETVPFVMAVQIACFLFGGMYRGLWRFAGVDDVVTIGRAVAAAVVASAVPTFLLYGFRGGASRVVFVLDALLLLLLVAGSRLSFRLLRSTLGRETLVGEVRRPVLIYGAGDAGALLVREVLNNGEYGLTPVGFIDDDGHKVGRVLHGLPIYRREMLGELIDRLGVTDVVISTAKIPEDRVRELRASGISLKRMRISIE